MTYYKVLIDGEGPYSGYDYTEYLPKDGKPGKWLPEVDKLELCASGYHVTDAKHLIDWIDGDQLFEVEVKGEVMEGDDKTTCQQIRLVRQIDGWNDKNLRLFACWCVEQALPIYEEELAEAWAGVAAEAAAEAAARAAAWDAVRDAQSIKLQEMVLGYTA